MNARQLPRLLALAVLVLLAAVGLRGGISGLGWNGPLRAEGTILGLVVEAILLALLVTVMRRDVLAGRGRESLPPAGEDDRDVAGALRFLLRYLIGAAIIAVGVVLAVSQHLHLFKPRPVPLRPPPTLAPTARPSARPSLPAHPSSSGDLGRDLLYALLVIALLAVLAFGTWAARRLRASLPLPLPPLAPAAEDAAGLREAVASGRAAMADLDDARAAIIACYAAMERSLAERGTARGSAGTPDELLGRAIERGVLRGGAARRLTALFYEARFSSHPLSPRQRGAAVAALEDLEAELRDSTPESGPPETGTPESRIPESGAPAGGTP
ncbi:MAG TPA: DUF4129 domain-containing protein [Trebonia sp.]|jgi:hypothetical protein|nr:DUF4129 domain-containing protein [Trebonia sp.]